MVKNIKNMLKCKICHEIETDDTSGICYKCLNLFYGYKIIKHKKPGKRSGKRYCSNPKNRESLGDAE